MDKLDFVARESAVVDGVMANGLVDNGQPKLALAYVLRVLKEREEVSERANLVRSAYCNKKHEKRLRVTFPLYNNPGLHAPTCIPKSADWLPR